jgi:hypothetical protein
MGKFIGNLGCLLVLKLAMPERELLSFSSFAMGRASLTIIYQKGV